jgi:fermentation-respiration switch protein FrsA (DUF1100 family)
LPALILHGELDTLIPLEHAKELYNLLQGTEPGLLVIQSAGHNDIRWVGHRDDFVAIASFLAR